MIYDIISQDDPLIHQLILADVLEAEMGLDQRENRLVPIEIKVLTVGYSLKQKVRQALPPQPPTSLDSLVVCDENDLRVFTNNLAYLRLVLNTGQVPGDELLVANLTQAAAIRPAEARYRFLLSAGRELARLLGSDLVRLESILKRIKPVTYSL